MLQNQQNNLIITKIDKNPQISSMTPREKNGHDREQQNQIKAIREYYRQYNESQRSSNVDDTNRTLSILDEYEAQEILAFIANDSKWVNQVWGDIYRNKFLDTIRNPPRDLTPVGAGDKSVN